MAKKVRCTFTSLIALHEYPRVTAMMELDDDPNQRTSYTDNEAIERGLVWLLNAAAYNGIDHDELVDRLATETAEAYRAARDEGEPLSS